MLSGVAIILGYLSEKSATHVFKHVRTWSFLVPFILAAYLCLGATTYYMIRRTPMNFEVAHIGFASDLIVVIL